MKSVNELFYEIFELESPIIEQSVLDDGQCQLCQLDSVVGSHGLCETCLEQVNEAEAFEKEYYEKYCKGDSIE